MVDGITRRKHATAEGALLGAEGMDDESSDDEQLQSSPLGRAPPSLPPGPPDDSPDAPLGSAGYSEMAVSVANPLSPAEAEATLEAGAAMVGVDLVDLSDLECLAELPDEVARAMAEGLQASNGARLVGAVTGIAGPGGGSDLKPVGRVHFAVGLDGTVRTHERTFPSRGRSHIQAWATNTMLNLMLRAFREGR